MPHHVLRGQRPTDARSLKTTSVDSVSRFGLLIPLDTFRSVGGFEPQMSPYLEEHDLCLKLTHGGPTAAKGAGEGEGGALKVLVSGDATIVGINPGFNPELSDAYESDIFTATKRPGDSVSALNGFVGRWSSALKADIKADQISDARVSWIIHCGGSQVGQGTGRPLPLNTAYRWLFPRPATHHTTPIPAYPAPSYLPTSTLPQGYEAATILPAMEPLVSIKTIIRRYR